MTNVKKEVFPAHVVRQVYSLRWQLELVKKAIKSHLGFEFILGKREDRISHLPVVAPQILTQLRHPMGLLTTLLEVSLEIMILCRMDQRKKRGSTAEILRTITV